MAIKNICVWLKHYKLPESISKPSLYKQHWPLTINKVGASMSTKKKNFILLSINILNQIMPQRDTWPVKSNKKLASINFDKYIQAAIFFRLTAKMADSKTNSLRLSVLMNKDRPHMSPVRTYRGGSCKSELTFNLCKGL